LLYLLAVTPLSLALTALLASADRSHHLGILATPDGLQLVLRHDGATRQTHRHGVVARTLVLFAQRATVPPSDHVIQFGAANSLGQPAEATPPPLPWRLLAAVIPCSPLLASATLTFAPVHPPRPPPVTSELLLSLRSNVLLI
jgi:hypothetical protein